MKSTLEAAPTLISMGHVLSPGTAEISATVTKAPAAMIGRRIKMEITTAQAVELIKKSTRRAALEAAIAELQTHLAAKFPA